MSTSLFGEGVPVPPPYREPCEHRWRFLREIDHRDIPPVPDGNVEPMRYEVHEDVFYCERCLAYRVKEQP